MTDAANLDGYIIDGGFSDPVFNAQRVFDLVMNATARPGTISVLDDIAKAPDPLFNTTAALLLTLCDSDTAIWFDVAEPRLTMLRAWLSFHTGASLADHPAEADFVVQSDPRTLPDLAIFSQGTQDYPDRSTTIILQVNCLSAGGALKLQGPGIKDSAAMGIDPLPPFFLDQWAANNNRFPCGVDLIFVSDEQLACWPRTTRVSGGAV